MDKLSAMRTFVRVVESGSFTAGAAELSSTPRAVRKPVAAREKEIGGELLVRPTGSLARSGAGALTSEQPGRLVRQPVSQQSGLSGQVQPKPPPEQLAVLS